jgi:hypothetical protein
MNPILIGADLIAISVLVFALFLPRHGRRDLIVAFLGVNVGVLAVAAALATSTVSAGLGLGLFGVLSIIRLRSEELTNSEVAYYFAALALGLLGGLGSTEVPLVAALMGLILAALLIGDHPAIARRTQTQSLVLDRAYADPAATRAHVERILGAEVTNLTIVKTDLVNDTTTVTVRYRPGASAAAATTEVTR